MPNTDTAATRSRTKGALLGGLRSGALEKAVEKMEDDLAAEEDGPADLEARLRALFASIDVDGNGVLSRPELATKLRQDTEIQTLVDSAGKSSMYLFEQLDADSDGSITVGEFLKLCVPYPDEGEEEAEARAIISVLGGPGSGKTSQSAALAGSLEGYTHLSVGQALKAEAEADGEHAEEIKSCMAAATLVPTATVTAVLQRLLDESEGTVLLDGFPRVHEQVETASALGDFKGVLFLDAPEDVLVERLSREDCPDATALIAQFTEHCLPVLDDLDGAGLVRRVDASAPIEDARAAMATELEALMGETGGAHGGAGETNEADEGETQVEHKVLRRWRRSPFPGAYYSGVPTQLHKRMPCKDGTTVDGLRIRRRPGSAGATGELRDTWNSSQFGQLSQLSLGDLGIGARAL